MDYSFQANGSFAVPILYRERGVFSTPRHKYFSCSWLCRLVFYKPQYFIVHGFAAGFAEMDGHTVVGGADPLREYAAFTRWLCLGLDRIRIDTIHVIGNNHPFCGAYAPCGLLKAIAGGFGFDLFFPLSFRPRSCVLPCLALGAFSRLLPLASRPGVFHAKVAAPGI
jgi:hypothetical protein